MDRERFEKQMAFILEIDKLKQVGRQNYLADGSRKENDAEHSWHLAMMALLLSEYAPGKVDTGKVILMVLMHDIVEIIAGDTYCYDEEGRLDKEEREKKAAEVLFGMLPDDQKDMMWSLWNEFEEGQTPEAEFAAILDRLQPFFLNYKSDGVSWLEHGVTREKVVERNRPVLEGPEPIAGFARAMLEDALKKGLLRP